MHCLTCQAGDVPGCLLKPHARDNLAGSAHYDSVKMTCNGVQAPGAG